MVEERPLKSEVLAVEFARAETVVRHEHADVLVGQEQQHGFHRLAASAVTDHALTVIVEFEKAVGVAQNVRVRREQRAVHLPRGGFIQNSYLGGGIAVETVLQVHDHETRHVRG